MQYYKVLLVDDEVDVRQAIARTLDWESLGFQLSGEASNGEEALELSEQLQPDVILTDIKMPFMDGLTFCRRVKAVLPSVRVAVFSGFDEFEYAKEAIKLEVQEYILKPINAEELAGVFRRLRVSLDEEIARKQDLQSLRHYYEESLPLMQQQLLMSLLEGHADIAALPRRLEEFHLDFDADRYCVAVVRTMEKNPTNDTTLLMYSLQQTISEMLPLPCRPLHTPEAIVLLLMPPAEMDMKALTTALNRLFLPARKILGLALSIGVGHPCEALPDVARSYREAWAALEYQILVDADQCVYLGDIEPDSGSSEYIDSSYTEDILRQIKVGSREDLEATVKRLLHYLKSMHLSLQQHHIFLLDISTGFLGLIRAYKLDAREAGLEAMLTETSAFQSRNLDEMGRRLLEYCENLRRLIRRERKNTTRLIVDKACAYLLEHYPENDLSSDGVCTVLNLRPAYFSTIFKRETGLNFVAFLTKLRMEKALEYLDTTSLKTYEIADKVGYADANYFSYVFKKHYGVSPSKYRTDRMTTHETGQAAGVGS
ncbi:MAG: response regulator [Oscillospiraceae bacterium]|jgi:two-component system response regulator YesN|nr:response regulator [Oscillospiraceae bacterium]